MFSLTASGSLAKTITFATWKGRPYARELVTPNNPKSGPQVGLRAMFGYLAQRWTSIGSANQDSWIPLAEQITASTFNAYMRFNQKLWRDNLAPTKNVSHAQVGTLGATPTLAATGGVRSVLINFDVVTENQNWGVIIYRSTTTAFTPALDTAKKIMLIGEGTIANSFLDSPLIADTYFYNAILFTLDGVLGSVIGEQSAVVT